MSEEERQRLLEKMRAVAEESKTLTREEATKRLIDEGFLTPAGNLSPMYGGESKPAR